MNTIYNKPYSTPDQLLQHLKSRKLIIEDDNRALHFLTNINYHRFKIYLRVFWDDSSKEYKAEGSFDKAVELYRFDDELRDILFSIIGRIEIKLRSRLDHQISNFTQNPFWYLNDTLFSNTSFRFKLDTSFTRDNEEYSNHYKNSYLNDTNPNYKSLPPFWAIVELTAFGSILEIFKSFKKPSFQLTPRQNVLDDLAKEFGAKNLKEINNWLDLIRDVRNKCAHHSRLWNRNLRAPSSISPKLQYQPAHSNRIYLFLVLLETINQNFRIETDIKETVKQLFLEYPTVNKFLGSMGFPQDWETDSFWQ